MSLDDVIATAQEIEARAHAAALRGKVMVVDVEDVLAMTRKIDELQRERSADIRLVVKARLRALEEEVTALREQRDRDTQRIIELTDPSRRKA